MKINITRTRAHTQKIKKKDKNVKHGYLQLENLENSCFRRTSKTLEMSLKDILGCPEMSKCWGILQYRKTNTIIQIPILWESMMPVKQTTPKFLFEISWENLWIKHVIRKMKQKTEKWKHYQMSPKIHPPLIPLMVLWISISSNVKNIRVKYTFGDIFSPSSLEKYFKWFLTLSDH